MPIQGDQRPSRSKIDSGRAILPSISGERRLSHRQWLLCLRVPKCVQMRGGLEASRPRASPGADVTGHSTEVLDVDAAPVSEILAGFLAEYGSGSEDADVIYHHVIDVDQEVSQAADSRMKELRKKWAAHVKKTQQGK